MSQVLLRTGVAAGSLQVAAALTLLDEMAKDAPERLLALLRKAIDRDYEIPPEVAARLRADHLITDEGNLWDCLRDVVRAAVTGTSPADVAVRPLEDVLAPPSAPRTAVLRRGALLEVLKARDFADRERVGEDEIVAEATPQDLLIDGSEGESVGRGILAPDAFGVLRPTVFGLLCYGRQPQAHRGLRSAFVELCHYAGPDRAADVILRGEAKGRLDEQVEATQGWLRAREMLAPLPHGARRVVFSLAVRAAVAHRDYDITGSKVLVEVFTDRIDITWPGLGQENPRISACLQCPLDALPNLRRMLEDLRLPAPQQQVCEEGRYVRLTLRLPT